MQILSDNYQKLRNQFLTLGAWDSHIAEQIKTGLANNKTQFKIPLIGYNDKEPLFIGVNVMEDAGKSYVSSFNISRISIPVKALHTVDIVSLERKMAGISWHSGFFDPRSFEVQKTIFSDLQTLKASPDGRQISDLLYLKYITSVFDHALGGKDITRLPFVRTQGFPVDARFPLTLLEGATLFVGRIINKQIPGNSSENAWFRLHPTLKDIAGNKMLMQLSDFYNVNLPTVLKALPLSKRLDEKDRGRIIKELLRGNVPVAVYKQDGRDIKVKVSLDLINNIMAVLDNTGKVVQAVPLGILSDKSKSPYVAAYDSKMCSLRLLESAQEIEESEGNNVARSSHRRGP